MIEDSFCHMFSRSCVLMESEGNISKTEGQMEVELGVRGDERGSWGALGGFRTLFRAGQSKGAEDIRQTKTAPL
jgi:hypothetical protein